MEITKKNDSKRSQVWWFFCLHSFLPSQNASRVHEASTCCVWRQEEEALILILMMILGEKKCRERERIRVSMEFPKNNSNRSQVWWFFFLPSLTKCIKNPWSFHLLCEDKKQKPLTLIMIHRERERERIPTCGSRADIIVRRVVRIPLGVPDLSLRHARNSLISQFHAPETTSSKSSKLLARRWCIIVRALSDAGGGWVRLSSWRWSSSTKTQHTQKPPTATLLLLHHSRWRGSRRSRKGARENRFV